MPIPSLTLRRVVGRMLSWNEVDDNFDRHEQRDTEIEAIANAALPKAGGTMTGVINYDPAQPRLVMGTTKLTTSGTSIDFTGIPSWAKRITLSLAGVSVTGTSNVVLRLGDSGGIETNGYLGAATLIGPGGIVGAYAHSSALGFNLLGNTPSANSVDFHGSLALTLIELSSNTWGCSGNLARTDVVQVNQIAGSKALSAILDRIQLTTVGGSDTFDLGKANILYEG